ncbi:MAG: hypothetical protein IKG81_12110 [Bacteroidales bacterium]|nr:hypothetical protein [Bacteroidales bacterium]
MNQYVNIDRLFTELVRVERNLEAVALATGVALPEVMAFANEMLLASYDNNNNNRVAPLPLPKGLRNQVRDMEALERALQRGYVVPMADHWEWTAGSKTLLAYFMGRLLCGDCPRMSRATGRWLWKEGKGCFPDKELRALFGMGSLRSLRKNGFLSPLPQGHEMIDNLFDKE